MSRPRPGRLAAAWATLRFKPTGGVLGVLAIAALLAGGLAVALLTAGPTEPTTEPAAPPGTAQPAEPLEDPALAGSDGAGATAQAALITWAQPDASPEQWWEELAPLLTPAAQGDYAGTRPEALPRLQVERFVELRPGPSPDTVTVVFDTTEGQFGVDMSRRDEASPWLVVRFLFPGQESSLR